MQYVTIAYLDFGALVGVAAASYYVGETAHPLVVGYCC
jgi:hypothetical protein